jgi:signal peptidase
MLLRSNKVPQIIKRIWNTATTIFVILIVLIAILLVGVRLVGIQPYTVLSGSMEPEYHVGSLIYVKPVDPLTLNVRDPVTFMLNENTVATHRIVERIPDETDPTVVRFRTKGDNNDDPDGALLHSKNVIGKPIFTIPYLGYLANYVQKTPGRYIALGVCAFLLVTVIFSGGEKKPKAAKESAASSSEKSEESSSDTPEEN